MAGTGFTPLRAGLELVTVASRIIRDLPFSASMHNNLWQHGLGYASQVSFKVLEHSRSSSVVLWRRKPTPEGEHIGLHCLEGDAGALLDALAREAWIDWRGPLKFHHVPPYLSAPLQQLAESKGCRLEIRPHYAFAYQPHMDLKPLRVGAGLRVCRLGRAGISRLLETNRFAKNIPLDDMCRYAAAMPCVGVYGEPRKGQDTAVDPHNLPVAGEEELPVSWVASNTITGDIGMLMTEEEYKQLGLAGLVVLVVARLQASQGFLPHGHAHVDNAPAQKLFKKIGCKVTHETFWMASSTACDT